MKTFQKLLFTLSVIMAFPLLGAQNITGDWYGLLQIEGLSLRINLHINQDKDNLSATIDSPDQGAYGITVDKISFIENMVDFQIILGKLSLLSGHSPLFFVETPS